MATLHPNSALKRDPSHEHEDENSASYEPEHSADDERPVVAHHEVSGHKPLPNVSEKVEQFLHELASHEHDKSWELCSDKHSVKVYRKFDPQSGLYRILFDGMIPCDINTCYNVLLNPPYRRAWDKIIADLDEKPLDTQHDPLYKISLLYTSVRAPLPLTNRDFVLERAVRDLPEKKAKIVFDISIEHPSYKPRSKYIRADTKFSGLLMEPCMAPSWDPKVKELVPGTAYRTLTLVDVCGDVPKALVNMISAKSTVDWFQSYSKACKKQTEGKLLK